MKFIIAKSYWIILKKKDCSIRLKEFATKESARKYIKEHKKELLEGVKEII